MKLLDKRPIRFFVSFLLLHFFLHPSYALGWSFSLPKPLPGENQTIPIAGSTVRIKGLTNQANKVTLNGRELLIHPDGSFLEDTIIPIGETELTVQVTNPEGKTSQYVKKIKARENSFFLAGIADGTLNFSESSQGFRLERDGVRHKNGLEPDGKVSYYLTGKLQGKYLFKSALDTKKSTQERLFTYIDPDKYYPIYGDNSTVVYDVNSQGKFYGLFEWDRSGAVLGNYQTQIGAGESKLLTYNRTLYGGKVHLETPKRTVYGDPVAKATGFIAEANQSQGHSELLATGGSLYYLRHRNIVEGSEQVRIEVHDKRSGMILSSKPQAQGVDYEIKYDEGRILFRRPVLSVAGSDTTIGSSVLQGNPVYIVANYEYTTQEAFPIFGGEDLDNRTGGLRISQHLGDHLRGGLTYVQEQRDEKNHRMVGGDTTVKIGNFTKISAEIAKSEARTANSYSSYNGGYDYAEVMTAKGLGQGTAGRIDANTSLGEYFGKEKGFLALSGYWQRIDQNFAPTDSLFEAGSRKYGADLSHQVGKSDKVRFLYEKGEIEKGANNQVVKNQLQAKSQESFTAQWTHLLGKIAVTLEYLYRDERESLSKIRDTGKGHVVGHLIGSRIQYDMNERTIFYLGQQLGITDLNDSFTSAGIRRRISDSISVYGQAGAGPMGNSVLAGLEKVVDVKNTHYSNYLLSNSEIDGRTSITSFGTNTAISETASLRRERQFVASDERGTYAANLIGYENRITPELTFDATYQRRDEKHNPFTVTTDSEARDATTARLAYIKPDKYKFFSRAEHRLNTDNLWQIVLDNEGEIKLTKDFFLFGEYEYSKFRKDLSRIDKKQIGLAFRPVDYDWFNALAKYIRFDDDRPRNLTSADGGFTQMQSQSDLLAGEYALDLPLRFQFVQKLAFKDQHTLAANTTNTIRTPRKNKAFLWVHRLNYHITDRIDIAAEYRYLRQRGSAPNNREGGILLEVTYQIIKNIAIGAGFNFTSFTDNLLAQGDLTKDHSSARGFFLRLQGRY